MSLAPGNVGEGLRNLDWVLLGAVLLMTVLGLTVLHGATVDHPRHAGVATKQAVFALIAFCGMCVAYVVHYRWINRVAVLFYGLNLAALVYVLIGGTRINGAKRWIDLGPIFWQPSETMKLATILVCAQWLALHTDKLETWRSIAVPGLICGLPALLVLAQPDLGSSLLFFLVFLTMLLVAGAPTRYMMLIAGGAIMGGLSCWPFLKPYQRDRLLTFVNPEADPLGRGYNVIQSKVAIGNGGVFGRGLGDGSQGTHGFLPEHHTDFIFATSVEQLGLLGALLILLGYLVIFLRMLRALDIAQDRFGGLVVAGITAIFAGHVIENIGMNMGMMPVTGTPLPMLSYGGTFLVTTFLAIGLVLNVASRRFAFTGW